MFRAIFYFFRAIFININFKKIKISLSSRIRNRKSFGGFNKVGKHTYLKGYLGRYSYIGCNCNIVGKVGKFSSISNNVNCVAASHPLDLVSTSPSFYSKEGQNKAVFYKGDKKLIEEKGVEIGNDVWIGENVLIKGGVKIGDGAVIGMGAVVTKDVEPYSIVGGCPAKLIRKRFDDETINLLIKSKWWDRDIKYFKENSNLFLDVEKFINKLKNEAK